MRICDTIIKYISLYNIMKNAEIREPNNTMKLEVFLKKALAPGMKQVWQMMHDNSANECLQLIMSDGEICFKISK